MKESFKEWIAAHKVFPQGSPGEYRENFFRALRDNPERVAYHISLHLADWSNEAASDLREAIIVCPAFDPEELIDYLKQYFAVELNALPA